ncbi:MAG: DUF4136 domain-containing protein [Deltaproteobacteria bacterium]|nr:DUF4136 domain-containing protein [Deltaproteobacteria bacterium]
MIRSSRSTGLVLALAALVLLACQTPMAVRTDLSESADFSGLPSYSWAGEETSTQERLRGVTDQDLDRWIRAAVDANLAEAGYERRADGGDFLVQYDVAIETQKRQQQVVMDRAGGSRSVTVSYREGSLVLEALAADTRLPLWRGWAEAEINEYLKPEAREARIGEAVGRILARFPRR